MRSIARILLFVVVIASTREAGAEFVFTSFGKFGEGGSRNGSFAEAQCRHVCYPVAVMPARKKATVRPKIPTLARLRPAVLRIARQYGVRNVRVFGSFARGEQSQRSDLDLLVDMPEGSSLLDLAGLKVDLEEAVKRKVDVVPARTIKPLLRDRILSEAQPL